MLTVLMNSINIYFFINYESESNFRYIDLLIVSDGFQATLEMIVGGNCRNLKILHRKFDSNGIPCSSTRWKIDYASMGSYPSK